MMMDLDPNEGNENQNGGGISQVIFALYNSERLLSELEAIGIKIKQLEDNLKFLDSENTKLDKSINSLQVHMSNLQSQDINEQYKDSAGVQTRHSKGDYQMRVTKDGGGYIFIVAELGKVDDDNLNQVLSEYLGTGLMKAVMCQNYDEVKTLKTYDSSGKVDRNDGLHAISLENLIPYVGPYIADDPQRMLDLKKPKLRNGELPTGFLGFAVNMILIDPAYLRGVTSCGYGLRETLFYNLFSDLQVYKTKVDMINAVARIRHGAISLDGGTISKPGIFMFGSREKGKVLFAKPSGSLLMEYYSNLEKQMKELKGKKEKVVEDIMRELGYREHAMFDFGKKKQEFRTELPTQVFWSFL